MNILFNTEVNILDLIKWSYLGPSKYVAYWFRIIKMSIN